MKVDLIYLSIRPWHHSVVVNINMQLHLTKPDLRFCAGSNPICGMLEIFVV